jgi:hypothetical protein
MKRKGSAVKARDGATLKRQLVALEKQWTAGVLATHAALELCWNSKMPRHEWPAWIEPATLLFSSVRTEPPAPAQQPKPITRPEQTRFLATIGDKLVSRFKVSAPAAARAAIEAMSAQGWEHGDKVVVRVKREMSKLAKDTPGRALHYSCEWDMRAMCKLAEQGKTTR